MEEQHTHNPLSQRIWPAVISIAGLPILAVALYSHFIAPDTEATNSSVNVAHLDPIIPKSSRTDKKIASVNDLTVKLAARLETSPDDPSGWLLLAQSYEHIQEFSKAQAAYAIAKQYGASDAELEKRLTPLSGAEK
jgi:cytochrome c-type biogenesis protein CcmH